MKMKHSYHVGVIKLAPVFDAFHVIDLWLCNGRISSIVCLDMYFKLTVHNFIISHELDD